MPPCFQRFPPLALGPMNSLGVIANLEKAGAEALLERLDALGRKLGLTLYYDQPCGASLHGSPSCRPAEDFFAEVDALLTLGGDGTLLTAVRRMGRNPIPVMGVNLGKLGFLTSVNQDNLEDALCHVREGTVIRSSRALLECSSEDVPELKSPTLALNDVVLSWGGSSHIARLEVSVDGRELTTYSCDGLIISTPTGSTGHSLSAGGPVLYPESDVIVVSPICPHAMTVRPVVIPGKSRMDIRLCSSSKSLVLASDGTEIATCEPGHTLRIAPSDIQAELLQLPGYSYWDVLRQKLNWRGSSV